MDAYCEHPRSLSIYHMLYVDGIYGEDNYGKTRLDEKHPCFEFWMMWKQLSNTRQFANFHTLKDIR